MCIMINKIMSALAMNPAKGKGQSISFMRTQVSFNTVYNEFHILYMPTMHMCRDLGSLFLWSVKS